MSRIALPRVLFITAAAALLAACTATDPYTGQQRTSNALRYGAVGGVVCGLIGAAESSQRARNAALGCGAIGAGVGAYMDAQERELREELEGTGVRVLRDGDRLELIMPGNITFNTDEYEIRPQFQPVLESVARVLYKYTDTRLVVSGHTDDTGNKAYNYGLSERRARSVADFLAREGLEQDRLIIRGLGPDQPVASNETASGRAQNRRVELEVVAVPR